MARNSFPMKLDFTRVQNLTTAANSLTFPNAMGPQTYGVLITALANTWVYFGNAASAGIASASQNTSTGVFTTATQAFTAGLPVYLSGSAPTGFTLGTVYYVIATGLTTTACELSASYGGSAIVPSASAACVINPLTMATATNSLLIKATDFAEEYGISPGQYISVLENGSAGAINIVELTH